MDSSSPSSSPSPSPPSPSPPSPSPLLSLPPELLFHTIIPHLTYPDALSLKHSSPHIYPLIDTSVRLKVAWLIRRKARGLECPTKQKCVLKTDAAFCAGGGGEIRRIMERRRRHEECSGEEGKGCEVVEGRRCFAVVRRTGRRRWVGWRLWGKGGGGGREIFVGMGLGFALVLVMVVVQSLWWR